MMISVNTPRRGKKRAIGLGLAVLSMSLLGSVSRADNLAAGQAINIPPNSGISNCGTSGQVKFYQVPVVQDRSYVIDAYPPGYQADQSNGVLGSISVAADSGFASPVTTASTFNQLEGSMNGTGGGIPGVSARFTATSTGTYFFKMTLFGNPCLYVTVRETTLFSPWLSRAAGYQGFNELHNNTNAAVSVTLRAYDSTGTLLGTGLTFSIPANATVFKTGTDIGVPAEVAVGVTLTHNGAFGAISGNITTLSGATGLSFDSAFAPRTDFVRMH